MDGSSVRIWGADQCGEIYLTQTTEGLEVFTSDAQDRETVVLLDARKIRELRLALQRFERLAK